MKTFSRYIPLLVVAILSGIISSAFATSPERRKARYYYLEGARHQAMDEMPQAFEYFKKAYLLDTTYVEAAFDYGVTRLLVMTDSMQSKPQLSKSLGLMKSFVDTYPSDVNEAEAYAYISGRLDTISEPIRIYERLDSLKPSVTTTLLNLSDAYMMAGNSDKALNALNRYESREGKSPQLSLKKINILLAAGDTVGAVRESDDLIATNPREPYFHILKGKLYEVIGVNDSVLASYQRAEELNPENGTAKISLATYYKTIGDSVAYDRKVYEALLSEDFDLMEKLSLLGDYLKNLLDDASDTSRGDYLFAELMDQYPHEPYVLDMAARYSGAKGDYNDAIQQISYAIDLDPSNPVYWQQLMSYQLAADKPKEAMETYKKTVSHIEPDDQMRLLYANAATISKDYQEAESSFAELLHAISEQLPLYEPLPEGLLLNQMSYEQLTRLSSIYSMLGDMYYGAEQLEKAYGAYDNSLFFNPENAMTLNNYAYFLTENKGDLEKAEAMASKAIELDPENDTFLDTMAWVLFRKKDYKEALEFQEKAIALAERDGDVSAELYNHYGDILFMNHKLEEAVENWMKALDKDPDNELLKKKVTHRTFFFE